MKRGDWVGGVTTFFTMAYIVLVNPAILATPGTGMSFQGVLTATVLLSFLMTLFMGLYAKLPFAVAPGMGVNAFFTYSLILGQKIPWPVALGMVFWSGVLFVLVSATPLRVWVAEAVPSHLRTAAAVGIGLFLTFIGLKNGHFLSPDPVTFVKVAKFDPRFLACALGVVIAVVLLQRKNPLAFLISILAITFLSWVFGWVKWPEQVFSAPDFGSVFMKLDPLGALKLSFLPAILSILFTDLFDSISTFLGVSQATGLVDSKGRPIRLREGLIVDAFATLGAGLLGTSSGTAYIESAAGIEAGARTGKASVVTAFCFLPFLFVAPLAAMVPDWATAPVLILVGSLMFRSVKDLKLSKWEEALPSFLTLALIPLTFSITQGILWGFLSHVVLFSLAGRAKEIPAAMWGVSGICGLLLGVNYWL